MRRVDAFLTNKAQVRWPEAVIYLEGGTWYLDRGPRCELVNMGGTFRLCREGLRLMLRAEAAREKEEGSGA